MGKTAYLNIHSVPQPPSRRPVQMRTVSKEVDAKLEEVAAGLDDVLKAVEDGDVDLGDFDLPEDVEGSEG